MSTIGTSPTTLAAFAEVFKYLEKHTTTYKYTKKGNLILFRRVCKDFNTLILNYIQSIIYLDLNNNDLKPNSALSFAPTLVRMSNLELIDLSSNYIKYYGLESLSSVLAKNQNLLL